MIAVTIRTHAIMININATVPTGCVDGDGNGVCVTVGNGVCVTVGNGVCVIVGNGVCVRTSGVVINSEDGAIFE